MSTTDIDEPMDNVEPNRKGIEVTLSVQWCTDSKLAKRNYILETALQTWATNHKNVPTDEPTCNMLHLSEDSTMAVVSFKPPPDLSGLAALNGQTLDGKDGNPLTVTSVSWAGAQAPEDCVMNAPQPPPTQEQVAEEGCAVPPAAEFTAGDEYFVLPAERFLGPSYAKEVSRIEKENNCVLKAELKVSCVKGEGDGNPQRALSEFKALVQSQPHVSVVSLERPDPEGLMDMQVAQSSLERQGPSQSIDTAEAFSGGARSADVPEVNPSYQLASAETPGNIKFDIRDPLFSGGISIDEGSWQLMTTSYLDHTLKLQEKFGVEFTDSCVGQGEVRVSAVKGRNVALENHAVRALFHLYKRIITSPFNTNQHGGATGFTDPADPPKSPADPPKYPVDPLKSPADPPKSPAYPLKSPADPPKSPAYPPWYPVDPLKSPADPPKSPADPPKSPADPQNGRLSDSTVEAAAGGGVGKDDDCPICLDEIEEKAQLDCKHGFCRACLRKSVDSLGPCCPVCKHVFGPMIGNQPEGTMTKTIMDEPLPGFPKCKTIVITYHIPDGIQTKGHPNPGQRYRGTKRVAYLPSNKQGQEVLELLGKAFKQKLIFTIGQSRTNGTENQVTWNDIHHKTAVNGGPERYGYPDPNYLKRVRSELKDKGIK